MVINCATISCVSWLKGKISGNCFHILHYGKNFPHLDFFWSVFFCIWTNTIQSDCGKIRIGSNTDTSQALLVGLVLKLKLLEVDFKFNGSLILKIYHFQIVIVFNAFFSHGDHLCSVYAKVSEKLTLLVDVCVSGGKKCYFYEKFCVSTKWMILI